MGAETATDLAAPRRPQGDVIRRRTCIRSVGELVRLYEELEQALARIDEGELERLATTPREGEQVLGVCARRVASLRRFRSRRVCDGPRVVTADAAPSVRSALHPLRPRRRAFVWEAVAFALGFAVSLLLIAGGA